MINKNFDVIVVGAGHAGLEAAFACAKLNFKTALITLNKEHIADAPCNPSIGGPAKGVVVREIDALGGMQSIATDNCQLQLKLLNSSKGAGVWALRAQIDKVKYHDWFLKQIKKQKNLTLIIDEVCDILTKNKVICGIKTSKHGQYSCKAVIVTTGTYLKPICHYGKHKQYTGPDFQEGSNNLSPNLKRLGLKLIRLKTGTPPRILNTSVDYDKMEIQYGTDDKLSFEHYKPKYLPFKKQVPCYLTYTNAKTHEMIKKNINRSAMYAGEIHGIGPRYCPSIEDKIMRFADKSRHQLFVEPESLEWNTVYFQGLSTSFDKQMQEDIVHSIAGFGHAKILKYAYAIEYDAIDPTQLKLNFEYKNIKNLFFAGQINGTSGYEEAAGQGLLAGINAALNLKNKKPLILSRTEAYLGVLTEDIMIKGITEPYRLLTSRAEHRLFLRNDNAQDRLIKYGYNVGLVKKEVYQDYLKKNRTIASLTKTLKNKKISDYSQLKKEYKTNNSLYNLLKRPEVSAKKLLKIIYPNKKFDNIVIQKLEINIKFDGYIKNEIKNIKKLGNLINVKLDVIKDYRDIKNLALEARDKLNKIKPATLHQASQISGINLVDIAIIKNYLNNLKK